MTYATFCFTAVVALILFAPINENIALWTEVYKCADTLCKMTPKAFLAIEEAVTGVAPYFVTFTGL